MNDRSELPPERRRIPLDRHRKFCQVTSAFPTAKPAKVLMGDPRAFFRTFENQSSSWLAVTIPQTSDTNIVTTTSQGESTLASSKANSGRSSDGNSPQGIQ